MESYREQIEAKYRGISWMPEQLLSFTYPLRETATALLGLSPGSTVVDVGCGTGASFPFLEKAVGETGRILGIEPSRSMLAVARHRVQAEGWQNIELCESTIEEVTASSQYDGALLFAMHDVFNSLEGLKKVHRLLKDGARIVCTGPVLQEQGFRRMMNPMLRLMFRRMALSQENLDKPWRLVEQVFTTVSVSTEMHGLIFVFTGRK